MLWNWFSVINEINTLVKTFTFYPAAFATTVQWQHIGKNFLICHHMLPHICHHPGCSQQCKGSSWPTVGCWTQDFRPPYWPCNPFQKVFPYFHRCHHYCHCQVGTVGSVNPVIKAGVNPNLPCSEDTLANPTWGRWNKNIFQLETNLVLSRTYCGI